MFARRLVVTAWLGLISATTSPARAQQSGAAAALFEQGLADMHAGRLDEACPKLAESYRLDTRPGSVFTLAECEARWGKVSSAVAHYDDYLRLFAAMPPVQQASQRDRAAVAQQRRAALKPRIPSLTLILPPDAPPSTVVQRDGIALGAPSLGAPSPVDPGTHVVTTRVPGGQLRTHEVQLAEGEHVELRLEVDVPPQSASPAPRRTLAAPPRRDVAQAGSWRRPIAYGALGLGAIGIGFGAVAGAVALGKKGDIEANCRERVCNPLGKETADRAQGWGWASTVGFGVGAAGAAAGVLLLVTDERQPPTHARPAPQLRGVASFDAHGGVVGAAGTF